MEPWKGQESLLRALARLHPSRDWEAWIVGGAQRPEEEEGLPVVGARSGATPEIVGEENGILVSPGVEFVSGLAAALEDAIARIGRPEEKEAFRVRNPKRARALCDPRTQLAAMHEFFERVRNRKGSQNGKGAR